jgi:hypothetical protein
MALKPVIRPASFNTPLRLTVNGIPYLFLPGFDQYLDQPIYDHATLQAAISAGDLQDSTLGDVNPSSPATPLGPLYIDTSNKRLGVDVTTPQVTLDISGGIKIGNTTADQEGIIKYTGTDYEGRTPSGYVSLTSAGGGLWTAGAGDDIYYNPTTPEVGIGLTNPVEMLDVAGGVKLGAAKQSGAGTMEWDGSNFVGHDGAGSRLLDATGKWVEFSPGSPFIHYESGSNFGVKIGGNSFLGTNPVFEIVPPLNRAPIFLYNESSAIVLSSIDTGELGFFIDPPTVDQNEKVDFNCVVRFDDTPAPAGNPVNAFYLFADDRAGAGTAIPHFRTEEGDIVMLFQAAALTAIDNAAISTPFGPEEEGVITNNRTRISEIEAALQAHGLLG